MMGRINYNILGTLVAALTFVACSFAAELPPELPLWEETPRKYADVPDVKERLRSHKVHPKAPSGSNRVYNSVSVPTYSIHRPAKPNGVGLVVCPGGAFRDVWIDREGHDLAVWLKDEHNVTCLVLKYRTRLVSDKSVDATWQGYLRAVRADGLQAVRVLRSKAPELGLRSDKIGICGFSAGGYLSILCALSAETVPPEGAGSGIPSLAGLFYPGIPADAVELMAKRMASSSSRICPMFIINARADAITPAGKCIDFYSTLLKAGVNAELHVFNKGGHGFSMGVGRGQSTELWPDSFAAWLRDVSPE